MTDEKERAMEVLSDGLGRIIRLPTVSRPAHVEKRPQRKQTPPPLPLPSVPSEPPRSSIKQKPKSRDIVIGSCPICQKRYLLDQTPETIQYGEDKTVIWPCVKHRKPAP